MTPAHRIAQLAQSLDAAQAALAEGARLDLAGMCATVETAMAEVAQAPLAEHTALVQALLDLMKELDGLVAALARQHHAAAQARAAAAYGTAAPRGGSEGPR